MTLSPNATGGDEEYGTSTTAKQKVSCQQSDLGEVLGEELGDGKSVGSEDGTQRSGKYTGEAEEEGD